MEFLKKEETKKMMLLIKKIVVFSTLSISIIFFLYAISFFTDLYQLEMDNYQIWLFKSLQTFNKAIFNYSVILLVLSAFLFFLRTQIRKKLYLTNILICVLTVIFTILSSIYMLSKLPGLRSSYSKFDLTTVKVIYTTYQKSFLIFDLGIILAILLIVSAITLLIVTIYQIIINSSELKADLIGLGKWFKSIFKKKNKRGEVNG